MSIRDWIRVAAVALLTCGLFCLPRASEAHPGKAANSLFFNLAETGEFMYLASKLILAGLALFALSFVPLPRSGGPR